MKILTGVVGSIILVVIGLVFTFFLVSTLGGLIFVSNAPNANAPAISLGTWFAEFMMPMLCVGIVVLPVGFLVFDLIRRELS